MEVHNIRQAIKQSSNDWSITYWHVMAHDVHLLGLASLHVHRHFIDI